MRYEVMTACVGRVGRASWANLFRPLTASPTRARLHFVKKRDGRPFTRYELFPATRTSTLMGRDLSVRNAIRRIRRSRKCKPELRKLTANLLEFSSQLA